MAIQVITYKNSAEIIRMDKSAYLSNRQDMTNYVKFEGGQNLLSPTFYINSTTEPTFNYVHIPDFNRYYFVDSKQWVGNSMWFITLSVDVLFSHKDDILELTGIASRLEDQGDYSMIIDDRITAEATQYEDVEFQEFDIAANKRGFNIQTTAHNNIVFSAFSGDVIPTQPISLTSIKAYDENGNEISLTKSGNIYTGSSSSSVVYFKVVGQNIDSVSTYIFSQLLYFSKDGNTFTSPTFPLDMTTTYYIGIKGSNEFALTVKINKTS